MEIAANVHWIEKVNANVYACLDEDGVTLIDTGLPGVDRVDLIFNYLERLKLFPTDIRRILITHAHSDHAGNVAHIAAESGAVVMASADAKACLISGRMPNPGRNWVQRLLYRFVKIPAVPQEQIQVLDNSNRNLPVLGGLEVIPSPGHTDGHISFFNACSGVLFGGDALNTRRGELQCTPKIITADLEQAYRSAVRLLQYNPAVFACGHGRPMDDHTIESILILQELWLQKATRGD